MTTPETPVTPPAPETPVTPPAAAPTDWTAGLDDDTKGYVQNKGFKDPTEVLKSYRNFEKLMGVPQDRILKLPEKAEDSEAWNSIYHKLGRPEKPEEYKFSVGEKDDPNAVKWAQSTFHELGLTRTQAEKLYEKFGGFATESAQAQANELELKAQAQVSELKKEWGSEFDQRMKQAKAAAQKFGLDGDAVDAIEKQTGFAGVMKFLHAVGSSVGEDTFIEGDKGGGKQTNSKEAAMAQIKALMSDTDFQSRLSTKSAKEVQEWDRLHVLAYSAEK